MSHDVFISYSDRDKIVAEAICATLESRHIRCWIAPRDILPGSEWAEAVIDAIDESPVFVLVLSSTSNKSPQVVRELGRAAGKGIPIIPFRIDDVPPSKAIEFFVSSHHWLDAQTPPLEKHLSRLADTVQSLLGPEYLARKEKIEKAEPAEAGLRCAFHPDREAIGTCVNCGKPVCQDCSDIVNGKYYCHQCAEQVLPAPKAAPPERPAEPAKPPEAEKVVARRSGFWWVGIALLSVGAILAGVLIAIGGPLYNTYTMGQQWYSWYGAMLIFTLPFAISGVCCLRLAISRQFRDEPATGGVPDRWWSLPIVLGFLGGIISWVKQKHVNWRTSRNMLTLGILLSFIVWVIPVFILIYQPPAPPAGAGVLKPEVGFVPENWYLSDEADYPEYGDGNWGLIQYMDEVDYDFVQIWYGDVPSELKGRENDSNALISQAVSRAVTFEPTETGTMTVGVWLAGYAKAYNAEINAYEMEIVFVYESTCVDIYTCYDATSADEAQAMSLINSIYSPLSQPPTSPPYTPPPEAEVLKPGVGVVPENWYLSDEANYPEYGDGNWGLIQYTDEVDYDFVQIWYGDVPPELEGKENDSNALISQAVSRAVTFEPTETGTMTVGVWLSGYAKAYNAEIDVYEMEIVFVYESTCIDIYTCYDATSADEAQAMSLINSIYSPR